MENSAIKSLTAQAGMISTYPKRPSKFEMSKKFKFKCSDTMINTEDPNLTDEELMWERLKHGIQEESIDDLLATAFTEELRKEIDVEILRDIKRIANDFDK